MMKTLHTEIDSVTYKKHRWISFDFFLKLIVITFIILALNSKVHAQAITTTQNSNSQSLAQLLAGSGVTISNYTLTCAANGSGTFNNTSSNLGIAGGVVLSSGKVQSIPNNANTFASTSFTLSGDAQLSTLTNGQIY